MKKFIKNYLTVKEHFLDIPYYGEKRRVRVLLPYGYFKSEEKYPVIYMHDGQNIFHDKESFIKISWQVIKTIKYHRELPKVIVVAIDKNEKKRMEEYSPFNGGLGFEYGKWLVEELKPFIDNNYKTKSDKDNTLLAGSSAGGIITAFLGSRYPEVFGKLGVFSLASFIFPNNELLDFIYQNPIKADNKIFIQVGTKEGNMADEQYAQNLDQAYINSALDYYQALIRTGNNIDNIKLMIMANETHNEYFWAKHFVDFLHFAFAIES